MTSFYITLHDFNSNKAIHYDLIKFLHLEYEECSERDWWWPLRSLKKPSTRDEWKEFTKVVLKHQFWGKAESEFLMVCWPPGKMDTLEECQKIINNADKVDGWFQIEPNLDIIVDVFIKSLQS